MSNPYRKSVRHLDEIDIYQIGNLYEVKSHAVFHALKKLLCAGKRGAKDYEQDLMEAIESIERELQIVGLAEASALGATQDCGFRPTVHDCGFDEQRIDVIGQNGNEGEHYGHAYSGPIWWMTCPSCKGLSKIGVDVWMPCECCGNKFKVSMEDISKAKMKTETLLTDGWRYHTGGPCPVSIGERIEIEHRNGDTFLTNAQARGWEHYQQSDDIVRYRPV